MLSSTQTTLGDMCLSQIPLTVVASVNLRWAYDIFRYYYTNYTTWITWTESALKSEEEEFL